MNSLEKFLLLLIEVVRHDLANYSLAIGGYVELSKTADDAERKIYLEKIGYSQESLNRLSFLLKEYGKGGSNSWWSLTDIYSHCILPQGVAITVEEGIERIYVYANSLIPKALENLFNNTIRHGVKVTKIEISFYFLETGDLVIVYKDDGVGIPYEDKDHIFRKGFGSNTGLGLFLVKSILDITDMEISENGHPGKGVEFRIVVPQGAYIIQ